MATPVSGACVQVAFPAAVPRSLACHQRLRLCDPQLYGRTVTAISAEGVSPLPARPLRRTGVHALARDQRRQATSTKHKPIVSVCLLTLSLMRQSHKNTFDIFP